MQKVTSAILQLTDDLLISKGSIRACYRHPLDNTRCVKVYRQLSDLPQASLAKTVRILLGSRFDRFNINVQEYRFWLSLYDNDEISSILHSYIPVMDGIVQSNLGVALVEEMFMDADGEPSKTLLQLKGELTSDQLLLIQNDLRVITDCVIKHAIPMYDWNPTNILIVRDKNRCDVKIPDLEGEMANKELIKISRWCISARRRKLHRRIERFFARLNIEIVAQSRQEMTP
jgi:hypothetical protein